MNKLCLLRVLLRSLQKVYKANYEKSRGFSINYCDTPKFQMDTVLKRFTDVRINSETFSRHCVRLSGILWWGSILQTREHIFVYLALLARQFRLNSGWGLEGGRWTLVSLCKCFSSFLGKSISHLISHVLIVRYVYRFFTHLASSPLLNQSCYELMKMLRPLRLYKYIHTCIFLSTSNRCL